MKKKLVMITSALLVSLFIVVPVLADQSGISGDLWDSEDPPARWTHGATIYATNCSSDGNLLGTELYATVALDGNESPAGHFDADWDSPPTTGTYVCLYVVWNSGGVGTPADTLTDAKPVLFFASGRMNFGNIQSGTGPNAITLANVTATSANIWLPVGLAAVALVALGAVVAVRKRR